MSASWPSAALRRPDAIAAMTLPGRVALVTGAGRRVGRAIALALGACGMHVVVHYNASDAGARETARLITEEGGSATIAQAELSRVETCHALIDGVVHQHGSMHLLVNSAAMMLRTPVGELTEEQWDKMFALNARAPFFLAQRAAPALREASGSIVNIADLAAFESWPAYIPHSMTKAAIVQMTRGLAHALAPHVRVNAIAPGAVLLPEGLSDADAQRLIDTTPLRRLGSPEDVASAAVYLAGAEFVTGETIVVDGGRHVRT